MAQRGFNIGIFRSEVNRKKGILTNNKFLVEFNLPRGLIGTTDVQTHTETTRTLQYWCEDVLLPSFSLTDYPNQRYGYGAYEHRPVGVQPKNLRCVFRENGQADVQKLFHRWMNLIFNVDMRQGPNAETGEVNTSFFGGGGVRSYNPYELSYRQEYLTDMNILIFNSVGDTVRDIIIRDALPLDVAGNQLGWHENNTYFRLPVTFGFTDYYDQNV